MGQADPNPAQTNATRQIRRHMERLEDLAADSQDVLERARHSAASEDIRPLVMRKAGEIAQDAPLGQVKIDAAQFEPLFEREMARYEEMLQRINAIGREQEQLLDKIRVNLSM